MGCTDAVDLICSHPFFLFTAQPLHETSIRNMKSASTRLIILSFNMPAYFMLKYPVKCAAAVSAGAHVSGYLKTNEDLESHALTT